MVDKISEKQNEQDVIAAMKRGKDALRILHDEMGIDDVLNLMDDIRDQDEVEKRINEVLGGEGLRGVEDMEEEDILAELKELEEEVRLESEGRADVKEKLPSAPTKPLPYLEEQLMDESGNAKVAVAT
jgi:N-methylhydantoinase B/oxoprolinase/acetone carboxylase alpha subunit